MTFDFPTDSLLSGPVNCRVKITDGGTSRSDVIIAQSRSVQEGKRYTVGFMAKSSNSHTIVAKLRETETLQRVFWQSPELALADSPQHFGPYEFNCYLDAQARLQFEIGGANEVEVRLDSVWVTEEDRPGYVKTVDKFEKRQHTFKGTTLPYRLCPPDFYNPEENYPLALCLHGAGERGTDN